MGAAAAGRALIHIHSFTRWHTHPRGTRERVPAREGRAKEREMQTTMVTPTTGPRAVQLSAVEEVRQLDVAQRREEAMTK